ncbi:hypothetical protein [Candidatus Bacteroides intestinigallinarum]|jgi:hypothetical protein|uniref:hypothetical protein n=1 Tax=Candidatus Bacteroides intestinigallinarum TaxID=2838470 RepID=UPI0022E1E4AA|nr:hypothetical protein [Candidatus Bacteroides intestinigallinarum]
MSNKRSNITNRDIFVNTERKFTGKEEGEYSYNLSFNGNYELCDLSSDEVREIIACFQHALEVNEKGDSNERQ